MPRITVGTENDAPIEIHYEDHGSGQPVVLIHGYPLDGQVFEDIKTAIIKDRYAYFKDFLDNFYNVDVLAPERISNQAWQASFTVAAGASPYATHACVDTWLTDFRDDLPKIDVPTLVLHGTDDRILPYESTAGRLSELIDEVKVIPVEHGPHNIGWTHSEVLNPLLLAFVENGLDAVEQAQTQGATA